MARTLKNPNSHVEMSDDPAVTSEVTEAVDPVVDAPVITINLDPEELAEPEMSEQTLREMEGGRRALEAHKGRQ